MAVCFCRTACIIDRRFAAETMSAPIGIPSNGRNHEPSRYLNNRSPYKLGGLTGSTARGCGWRVGEPRRQPGRKPFSRLPGAATAAREPAGEPVLRDGPHPGPVHAAAGGDQSRLSPHPRPPPLPARLRRPSEGPPGKPRVAARIPMEWPMLPAPGGDLSGSRQTTTWLSTRSSQGSRTSESFPS